MTATYRLDTVCELTMGQAPEGESYNGEGIGLPLIAGAGDFGDIHPTAKKFTTSPGKMCQAGDIVLGIRATIGEKVIADREYCLGRGVAGLRAKPGMETRYLWHWLTHVAPVLASKARGATFKQVNRNDIGELAVNLPPLPEQRRIAEILDKAEALRAKRRAALALLDSLTQAIFLAMFGDPVVSERSWRVQTIEAVASSDKYSIVDGPFGSSMKPDDYRPSGVPVVRIANITKDGCFYQENLLFIEKRQFEALRRSSIAGNDVLVSRVGTLGNSCIFPQDFGDALLSTTGVCKITLDTKQMLPTFLHAAIRLPSFQRQIERSASTSVQKYFNLSALRNWRIIVPPISLQHEFARHVGTVEKLKGTHRASLAEMDALFASLQYRAFRGEL